MEDKAPKKHKGGYRQINKTLNICAFEDYLESQLSILPEIADTEQITPRVLRVLGQNAGKVTAYRHGFEEDLTTNGETSSHSKAQIPISLGQVPKESSSILAREFQNGLI